MSYPSKGPKLFCTDLNCLGLVFNVVGMGLKAKFSSGKTFCFGHISFENDGQGPDLIIEGFYDNADSALIGIAEDSGYYYYLPDTGDVTDYVTELQMGEA